MHARIFPHLSIPAALLFCLLTTSTGFGEDSVVRQWNEALLDAIRIDFPAPTVHARNLYHTSAAMYDAWAAYDGQATGHFYTEKHLAPNWQAARAETISYAAYRLLSERYALAADATASQSLFDSVMDRLGYDTSFTATDGNSPAALGNRIAQTIHDATINDGANQANNYEDSTFYVPANPAMVVDYPSAVTSRELDSIDPNRWQPLYIDSLTAQNSIPFGFDLQSYIGPHWGDVRTFAIAGDGSAGSTSWSGIDPGAPPQLGGNGDADYRENTLEVIRYSNSLDPRKGPGAEMINISPTVAGNRPLGTHIDQGYDVNPITGQPYEDNYVKAADYGRVLAEFWADGPESETPPGHWNVIANKVSDDPRMERRIGGAGPIVTQLEWDAKLGLALNGAVHDSAVAAWGAKRYYDYVRPITMIRYQGGLGQSTDSNQPSFHPDGLPLVPELIELTTTESVAPGGKHRNAFLNANVDAQGNPVQYIFEEDMAGKVVILAWNHEPEDPDNELSGTNWILAENWVPYQQDNFVTPAFAAYVSGHSTFSRAAAEVLAQFTGSEFFPGGLGEMEFSPEFLDFEVGPSELVTLQWATFFDAADEAGISRLWGGIHVAPDDLAGRVMGSEIGLAAYQHALQYFASVPEPSTGWLLGLGLLWLSGARTLCTRCRNKLRGRSA